MSLEWDTTFPAMFIGCGIKRAMSGTVAMTIYKGTKPSAETIASNWSNYKTDSFDILVHYTGGVWTQQPLQGSLLGLSTVPPSKSALGSGNASWAIIWMTDVNDSACASSTLPNTSFIVVDCSVVGGSGVVRFTDTVFTTGISKVIAEATIETN